MSAKQQSFKRFARCFIVIGLCCTGCIRFPVPHEYADQQLLLALFYNTSVTGNSVPYALPVSGAKAWLLGSYGVNTSGSILTWADQSGNGLDAVSVGTLRPTQTTNALNGHAVIHFSGTQRLNMGYLAMAQPSSVFIVARRTSAGTINTFFDGDANRNNFNHLNTGTYSIYAGTALNSAVISAASYRVLFAAYNGASSILGVDGFADTNGNAGATPMGTPMIGADSTGAFQLVGDIAEIIIYNKSLTGAERTSVTNYLKTRYGI
ncbi:MAG: hypothetical protein K8S54_20260 [Spirochaetia bacterium]|nr:hypothetical protein [Spirochaetia bacterium]